MLLVLLLGGVKGILAGCRQTLKTRLNYGTEAVTFLALTLYSWSPGTVMAHRIVDFAVELHG
jgi:hypothetical protein